MNFVGPSLFCRGLGHLDLTDLDSTVLVAIFLLYSFDHHRHGVVLVLVYKGDSVYEVIGNLGKPLRSFGSLCLHGPTLDISYTPRFSPKSPIFGQRKRFVHVPSDGNLGYRG